MAMQRVDKMILPDVGRVTIDLLVDFPVIVTYDFLRKIYFCNMKKETVGIRRMIASPAPLGKFPMPTNSR